MHAVQVRQDARKWQLHPGQMTEQLAIPPTDHERAEATRQIQSMHPGNRFRLMRGLTLLPLVKESFTTEKMNKDQQIKNLIDASIAYADLAERHLTHEESITKKLQQAAAKAREGNPREAQRLKREADMSSVKVFNYEDVHKALIKAVKPFRK
jgi:hypothetical protein